MGNKFIVTLSGQKYEIDEEDFKAYVMRGPKITSQDVFSNLMFQNSVRGIFETQEGKKLLNLMTATISMANITKYGYSIDLNDRLSLTLEIIGKLLKEKL